MFALIFYSKQSALFSLAVFGRCSETGIGREATEDGREHPAPFSHYIFCLNVEVVQSEKNP